MTTATPLKPTDTRRIAEHDADFKRLYAATRRDLAASVARFVRDLRGARNDGEESAAQSAFIQRHTDLMRSAYHRAYVDGQRDFYGAVSKKPGKWAQQPDAQRVRRALTFYAAPSIAKMAHEAVLAKRRMVIPQVTLAEGGAFRVAKHTGVMVAFMLAPDVAKKLALPGGESASDMHITLAFLGNTDTLTQAQLEATVREVASYAPEAVPLTGTVSGIGRFLPSPSSDGKAPVIALVNVPGLQEWREGLCKRLEAAGVPVAKTFAYTPHITLAYVDADAPMPATSVPAVDLALDRVTVAIGDDRQAFRIGDEQYPAYWEGKLSERNITLADDEMISLDDWLTSTAVRVDLQANLAWSGLQQGYYDGPLTDPANPYYYLYWDLEPLAQHCDDCPDYAAGSPYTPPGSGVNELDATPGDGHTACGAACKCSLRYGNGGRGDVSQLTWNQAFKFWAANPDQLNVPPSIASLIQGLPQPLALPSRDDLTVDQLIALDDYRDASIKWDMLRGDLAPLPGLFGEIDWTPPDYAALTPAQRAAFDAAVQALVDWGTATDAELQAAFDELMGGGE